MELWIRNQNKETLVKVNEVYIDETIIKANYKGYYGGCDYRILGEYKSKERALEVLDEMQKYIAGSFTREELLQLFGGTRNSRIVYEMPKE